MPPLTVLTTPGAGPGHHYYRFVGKETEVGAIIEAEGGVQARSGFWALNHTPLASTCACRFYLHGLAVSECVWDGDAFCYPVFQWIPLNC